VATKRYEAFQQRVLTLERLQQRDELASQLWQQSKQVKQQHQQYFAERERNATQLQSLSKRVEQVFERLTETVEQLQSLGVRFDRALNPVIKAQAQAVGQQEGQVLDQQQEWSFSR
jgi:seryl-tRNA synthetase